MNPVQEVIARLSQRIAALQEAIKVLQDLDAEPVSGEHTRPRVSRAAPPRPASVELSPGAASRAIPEREQAPALHKRHYKRRSAPVVSAEPPPPADSPAAASSGKLKKRDIVRLAVHEFDDAKEFTFDQVLQACPAIPKTSLIVMLSQLVKSGELLACEHEDTRRGYRKNLAYGK